MKNKSLLKSNKGFSLVEMIVAVLIMAIVAGAAIVAFSSVFSTEVKAAANKVADALKQTRTSAMALENKTIALGAFSRTNVYAKFYNQDDTLYIDVCTDIDGSEKTLYSSKIGGGIKAQFFVVGDDGTVDTAPKADTDTDSVKIYFKKSTGGVAGLFKSGTGGSEDLINKIKMIKISSSSNSSIYKDMVLVGITGRTYIDE